MGQDQFEEQFRQTWGNFPSGVSVVTFFTAEGAVHGLTASAICSVSLSPAMVLVCVDAKGRSHGLLERGGRFVMNLLAKGQEDACWYFAARGERGAGPFAYRKSVSGFPVLDGCFAYMDCRVVAHHPAGDHVIFIGEVEEIEVPGGVPLIFHQGAFAALVPYGGEAITAEAQRRRLDPESTGSAERTNKITESIIGSAIEVHKALGPGLLESVYEVALAYELRSRGHGVETQKTLAVHYKGVDLGGGYRLDLVVDNTVIIETKTVEHLDPVHEAQLLSYLRLSGLKVGLLINFQIPLLRQGIRRLVNDFR